MISLQRHDIIVIGASAGGVEALKALAAALPPDLQAAVFVVVHFPPYGTSVLPQILTRAGPLPALHPRDGEPIRNGVIYVAPPDHHLVLEPGHVRLAHGPRENGHRPAADPLFRTAARWYGGRVIGVVLSGNLDDGTAGLLTVHRRGGVAVVQDPDDAAHKGMPQSAVDNVPVHHVVPLDRLAPLLLELVSTPVPEPREGAVSDEMEVESEIPEMTPGSLADDERPGHPAPFTCPECHGALWQIQEGAVVRFRCRVGHAYGSQSLLAHQSTAVEAALWSAYQVLKERAAFARNMAERMQERGGSLSAGRFVAQAADADARAEVIREVLAAAPPALPTADETAAFLPDPGND